VTGCLGQYTFFAEERFLGGSDVLGDKLLENFVVGVSKLPVPFDAIHRCFVGHRVEYDTIFKVLSFV
jgi:hypothetical protein